VSNLCCCYLFLRMWICFISCWQHFIT